MENTKWSFGVDGGRSSQNKIQLELMHKLLMTVSDLNQNVQWISRVLTLQFPEFKRYSHCSEVSGKPYGISTDFSPSEVTPKVLRNCVQPTSHHQKVLQRNFEKIVNQVNLETSSVLETLYENDGIAPSDHEQILKRTIPKDKIRHLLNCLGKYGEKNFRTFIKSLKEYPELAKQIELEFLAEKQERVADAQDISLSRRIRETVNIRDVIDRLHSKGIISENVIDMVLKGVSNNLIWNAIFYEMKLYNGNENVLEVFCSALENKYDEIAIAIKEKQDKSFPYPFHYSGTSIPVIHEVTPALVSSDSGSLSDVSSMNTELKCRQNEKGNGQTRNQNPIDTGISDVEFVSFSRQPAPQTRAEIESKEKCHAFNSLHGQRRRRNKKQSLRVSPCYAGGERLLKHLSNNTDADTTDTSTGKYSSYSSLNYGRSRTDSSIYVKPLSYRNNYQTPLDSSSNSSKSNDQSITDGFYSGRNHQPRTSFQRANQEGKYSETHKPPYTSSRWNTDSVLYYNIPQTAENQSAKLDCGRNRFSENSNAQNTSKSDGHFFKTLLSRSPLQAKRKISESKVQEKGQNDLQKETYAETLRKKSTTFLAEVSRQSRLKVSVKTSSLNGVDDTILEDYYKTNSVEHLGGQVKAKVRYFEALSPY